MSGDSDGKKDLVKRRYGVTPQKRCRQFTDDLPRDSPISSFCSHSELGNYGTGIPIAPMLERSSRLGSDFLLISASLQDADDRPLKIIPTSELPYEDFLRFPRHMLFQKMVMCCENLH